MQPFAGRFQDPNRINLRKAGRAAIVVPVVFAVFVLADDLAAALFSSFGAFAALVFADFGGPLRRRFGAYLGLTVVGAVLVALGTAAADTMYPATAMALVVVFTVTLVGALGGYYAAGGVAANLAFVLAVMTPAVEGHLASRELGWVLGVLVAGIAAVVLWPVHQRDRVRIAAAGLLEQAASCLGLPAASRELSAVSAATAELATRAGVVYRPSGNVTRERALVSVVAAAASRLEHLLAFVTDAERSAAADPSSEYAHLRDVVAATLGSSARVLAGGLETPLDVDALSRARDAHTSALERWAAVAVAAGDPVTATSVVDRIDAAFPLRRLSLATVQIAEGAVEQAHDVVRSEADAQAALTRGWAMLRAHCDVHSVRFRNAARAGLGLAVAVLVAKTASVEHAFWVVLGALSVLRSNALGTGATAVQALVGALFGFAVASAVILTVGGDDTFLWILLPLVVFLAAYTPGAVNYVVGQGAFTVFVVVLFNVLVPDGWRTGLVRVQDIAIGAGIAMLCGALLWPRGARGVARRSFAQLLRVGGTQVQVALDATLHGDDLDVIAARQHVVDARDRAIAALEDLSLEHGGGHVNRVAWNDVLVDALVLQLAADGIVRGHHTFERFGGCDATLDALDAEGRAVVTGAGGEADQLLAGGVDGLPAHALKRMPAPAALASCLAAHSGGDLHGAIGLVWVHEWLTLAAERLR